MSSWLIFFVVFVADARAQPLPQRMLAAEDARVTSEADMAPLLTGLRERDPRLVVQAVRALGRFERPALVRHILPLVSHDSADVRAAAANALGQALAAIPRGAGQTGPLPPEVATVTRALLARLKTDRDPSVTGIVAETLGRLPFRTADAVVEAERALAALLPATQEASAVRPGAPAPSRDVHPATLTGVVKGLETLVRVNQKLQAPAPETLARLRVAATLGVGPPATDLAFIRRLAWLTLNAAGAADAALIEQALDDPDPQVRRIAVLAIATAPDIEARRPALLARALKDASHMVRYDAVRVYSRALQAANCVPLIAAVDDPSAHVALAAIDALGGGCPAGVNLAEKLAGLAEQGTAAVPWHKAAHALVSLARVSPADASTRLDRFAAHTTWQVRMYAARAAAALKAVPSLERLAADAHDNVREAAITGLRAVRGHDADAFYIDALVRPDYQLVLTATQALEGSPNADRAVPALLASLARLTAERRDTSRDSRVAILQRLRDLKGPATAQIPNLRSQPLRVCLTDGDPVVARECAATLQALTGAPHVAGAAARPVTPAPAVTATRARITMQRGGTFELRLFPADAPATIARFATLVRKGYYNGLTFHRVVPNFVLQGGSPGANEYMGDGPFMRDELGPRTHARGTLGISTRGRDTGDAQIFINLADNPRLDHNYTVFAEVTSGMEIVDAIVEGDVIARVDVLEPPATQSGS